jgi:hypothetical protein
MNQDWICRKTRFQLETFATVTMVILKKMLEEDEREGCWVYDKI